MTDLEIKETLGEFVNLLNHIKKMDDNSKLKFLSRLEDILNHIEARENAAQVWIQSIIIRLEKLEKSK